MIKWQPMWEQHPSRGIQDPVVLLASVYHLHVSTDAYVQELEAGLWLILKGKVSLLTTFCCGLGYCRMYWAKAINPFHCLLFICAWASRLEFPLPKWITFLLIFKLVKISTQVQTHSFFTVLATCPHNRPFGKILLESEGSYHPHVLRFLFTHQQHESLVYLNIGCSMKSKCI